MTRAAFATLTVEIEGAASMKDGDLKAVTLPNGTDSVVVGKTGGKLHAVANSCSHLHLPLDQGMLYDKKLVCPFHGGSFDITTGHSLNAPALSYLQKYEVMTKGNQAFVVVPERKKTHIEPQGSKQDVLN